jgi:cytochrome P450
MTDQEIRERREAVANAVATNRLEGLEPDPATIAELERVARGEIDVADVLRDLKARVAAGEFRAVAAK